MDRIYNDCITADCGNPATLFPHAGARAAMYCASCDRLFNAGRGVAIDRKFDDKPTEEPRRSHATHHVEAMQIAAVAARAALESCGDLVGVFVITGQVDGDGGLLTMGAGAHRGERDPAPFLLQSARGMADMVLGQRGS